MKKQVLLFLCVFLGVATGSYAQLSTSFITGKLGQISKTVDVYKIPDGQQPTIDGDGTDAAWNGFIGTTADRIAWQNCDIDVSDAWDTGGSVMYENTDDYAVKYKLIWDDEYLYLLTDVTDQTLISFSTVNEQVYATDDGERTSFPYECDNIEVFTHFQPVTVNEGPWSLNEASQLRVQCEPENLEFADSITGGGWADSYTTAEQIEAGYISRTITKVGGYTVETRIPWAILIPEGSPEGNSPAVDNDFKFDLQPADRDIATTIVEGESARETTLSWNATWSRDWGWTDFYGTAKFKPEMNIPVVNGLSIKKVPATATVTIDGSDVDPVWSASNVEWNEALIDVSNAWNTDGSVAYTNTEDYAYKFKALWDADYLYLLSDVTDQTLISFSDINEQVYATDDGERTSFPYECDNIEVFTHFQPASINEGPWSLNEASQLRVQCEPENLEFADSITGGGWADSYTTAEQIEAGYISRTTTKVGGYTVETRIPWSILIPEGSPEDKYPVLNNTFKFDIQPADRDIATTIVEGEQARELTLSWNAIWGRDWGWTDYYGTATYDVEAIIGIEDNNVANLQVYPTVAADAVTIEGLTGTTKIFVTNTLGQIVSKQIANGSTATVNVSKLAKGVYIINIDGYSTRIVKN